MTDRHEKHIDESLQGTFPASDAPAWGGNKTYAEREKRDARNALSAPRRALADLQENSAALDSIVRANPWQVVAASVAAGFVLGFLVTKTRSR